MKSASGFFLTSRLYSLVAEMKLPHRKVNCGQARCLFFQMPHCFGQIISYLFFLSVWKNITAVTHTHHILSHSLTQKLVGMLAFLRCKDIAYYIRSPLRQRKGWIKDLMRSVVTWLAFSRVPPLPALAPAGSAQSLGKVNANTGWLAHMNHSIYIFVLLPFTLLLHVKFPVSFFQSISHLHSHLMGVISKRDFQ